MMKSTIRFAALLCVGLSPVASLKAQESLKVLQGEAGRSAAAPAPPIVVTIDVTPNKPLGVAVALPVQCRARGSRYSANPHSTGPLIEFLDSDYRATEAAAAVEALALCRAKPQISGCKVYFCRDQGGKWRWAK